MIAFRSGIAVLACALLPALAWSADAGWSLRLAAQDPVPFHGLPDGDDAGKPGMMMYPAPGLAGFLAGIATHGVIVNAMRDSARTEREKQADKVLDPYRDGLARFTQHDLGTAALAAPGLRGARLAPAQVPAQPPAEGRVVASAPLFYLTQEKDALVLDNSVALTRPGAQPWSSTIRVVSAPRAVADAEALKAESANLLALSLEIVLAQAEASPAGAAAPAYRTVRYLQGKKELFERAQVLDAHCGRALIRNLRGWLMSVPLAQASAAEAACPANATP